MKEVFLKEKYPKIVATWAKAKQLLSVSCSMNNASPVFAFLTGQTVCYRPYDIDIIIMCFYAKCHLDNVYIK